jgi:hypothetical protein
MGVTDEHCFGKNLRAPGHEGSVLDALRRGGRAGTVQGDAAMLLSLLTPSKRIG